MKSLISSLLICLCFSLDATAHKPSFHGVRAQDGDGVYSLLRRYCLVGYVDNINKFYQINALDAEATLIRGRKYKIPVFIYDYDGVSIRSTIGIDDWDLASRIAQFNRVLLAKGLRRSTYQRSKILWVPYHELNHESKNHDNTKTLSATAVHVPLFGPDDENVAIESQNLKGKIYYVVSGHGGPDPGAMSVAEGQSICEDEYAYDVSLRLARRLMENGATVHVIIQDANDGIRDAAVLDCDRDETCLGKDIPLSQIARLRQRTGAINHLYERYRAEGKRDQTAICIHVDSRSPHQRQDVFFYHFSESKSGRRLALNLQKTFREKYGQNRPNRGYRGTVSARNLYVLKQTDPTAVYVELANIRNVADRQRIMPESNRQALANWLYEGLVR